MKHEAYMSPAAETAGSLTYSSTSLGENAPRSSGGISPLARRNKTWNILLSYVMCSMFQVSFFSCPLPPAVKNATVVS